MVDRDENDLEQKNVRYAILSHTWGRERDEVSFHDFQSINLPEKAGMNKIRRTCILANRSDYEYAWVDTCCIDKTSSVELGASINSMFRWYEQAAVCFVYLEDCYGRHASSIPETCAWFHRGWTLQELLAPKEVRFYNNTWDFIGTKESLSQRIYEITRIPEKVFLEGKINDYSIAERMSWASKRSTKIPEDNAYCLLGIFDVNMPLIYGEGMKAFIRLQEEIMKRSNDATIFAWKSKSMDEGARPSPYSILASTQEDFESCRNIKPYPGDPVEYAITNMGLKISTPLILHELQPGDRTRYVLPLGFRREIGVTHHIGIYLEKVEQGVFLREAPPARYEVSRIMPHTRITKMHTFRILTTIRPTIRSIQEDHISSVAIFVPPMHEIKGFNDLKIAIQSDSEVPLSAWNLCHRLCFQPFPQSIVIGCSFFLKRAGHVVLRFSLLLDFRDNNNNNNNNNSNIHCVLLKDNTESRTLFLSLGVDQSTTWSSVEQFIPDNRNRSASLEMTVHGTMHDLKARIVPEGQSNGGERRFLAFSFTPRR